MSDAHPQGGNLSDMAKEGTKVPQDAAKPNVVPSGEQDKRAQGAAATGGLGTSALDQPALGASSLPEVVSASGGQLPADVGEKYSRSGGMEREHKGTTPHGGRNQPSH